MGGGVDVVFRIKPEVAEDSSSTIERVLGHDLTKVNVPVRPGRGSAPASPVAGQTVEIAK